MTKWIIAAVVAIIVIAGGTYLIVHKSSKTTPTTSTSSSSSEYGTSSSSQTPATSSSNNSTSSGDIVQTKTSNGTQYLADSNGKPLYTYGADTTGVSNCSGSCIASWPVYGPGTADSSKRQSRVTIITRADGTKQYAYNGMPLYTFTADSSGTPTGDNVSNFHLAKP